jgi:hypothetical protein
MTAFSWAISLSSDAMRDAPIAGVIVWSVKSHPKKPQRTKYVSSEHEPGPAAFWMVR